ncbi:MAG: 4-(cytidine 5'-diphospho)-2-C-methyl-D-erythritol kinase [Proteobacteria bacterium]|nr:4-(cytidine 5'-diphospho)-2-C-methyl-D-erythritol kinase [Pseudomonadota bacterium]NIS68564.1 4-(cytidine 5'-diphospho)-2-C-methyl-D-erythritol kinase [Pseudomonadota bacterium]
MPLHLFQEAGPHSLLVRSPAKVNLTLEVLGKRSDGYHNIRSVMVPIDLSDVLHITLTEDDRVQVSCDRAEIPQDEENLAYRAGLLVLKAIGKRRGFHIRIQKRIPAGAGLGGGSSNAAAALMGLNRLLAARLSRSEMMRIGANLGADVPFFVLGRPALATGVGERLEALHGVPRFWLVLVYPGIHIASRWAYERLNLWLTNPSDHIKMPAFSWNVSTLGRRLRNDLEKAVLEEYPVLEWIKQRLLSIGAAASLMSGSGSTIYGLFSGRREAEEAYDRLKRDFDDRDWEVFLAQSIGY